MRDTYDSVRTKWERLDALLVRIMAVFSVRLLRIALAIVFVWFGFLKVIGRSPVAELVAETVYWVPPEFFVPFLGIWEMIVGLGLLFAVFLRVVLLLFFLQMAGTFLVLVLKPEVAFQGYNPLLLTTEGEFVVKNLVLIASALVIGSTVRRGQGARE
jgi:uncharacterized membrane protein YkgB